MIDPTLIVLGAAGFALSRSRPAASVAPGRPGVERLRMKVLAVIPTYNERDNLPELVRAVLAEPRRSASWSSTTARRTARARLPTSSRRSIRGRVDVVHRTGKRGLGRSYVDGLQPCARPGDADLICQMDADWSHDPKYLPGHGRRPARTHDVVIGSRYLNGVSVVNWPLQRIILSAFANRYIRAVTGLRVHDCTSGFRCWRRETLARLPLDRVVV